MPKTIFVVDDNDTSLSMAMDALKEQYKVTAQLQTLQNGIVFVLSDMIENRDKGTGGHIDRISSYIRILVEAMLARGILETELGDMDKELLISAARLHDVGKILIPDAILNKSGKLTDEEFEVMKTHSAEGMRIIDKIIFHTGDLEFLRNAKLFAGFHHERWDGKGYPHGLHKHDIPLLGRIMAIVDVYDALVSVRPYKKAFTSDEAVWIITDCADTQFDPLLADLFYNIRDQFKEVAM